MTPSHWEQFQSVVSTDTLHCEKRRLASRLFKIRHNNVFAGSFISLLIAEGKPSIDMVLKTWHMHNGSHQPSTAEYTIYDGYLLHRVVWLDPRTLWRDQVRNTNSSLHNEGYGCVCFVFRGYRAPRTNDGYGLRAVSHHLDKFI